MKPLSQWTSADLMEVLKTVDRGTWIKIAVNAAVGIVFFVWVVWPAWFERFETENRIKTIKSEIQVVENLRHKKQQMTAEKEESLGFIQQAKERIFLPGEISLLLGTVSRLAMEGKVAIVASSPKAVRSDFPPPFSEQYQASSYDFNLEGTYHNFGQFVSSIESNPKLLRIQLFHIKPSPAAANEKEPKNTQIVDLTLSAASFKPAAVAEKTEKKGP